MGDKKSKKKDNKSLMDILNNTIARLEDRCEALKVKINKAEGKIVEGLKEELSTLSQQLDYFKAAKKEFEEQLAEAKEEEEKNKLESVLKAAILLGTVAENYRLMMKTAEVAGKKGVLPSLDAMIQSIFEEEEFLYVKREDVEDILQDEEFKEMDQEDPNRLKREEREYRQAYEMMIEDAFRYAGEEPGENFNANLERFKEFLKVQNGYAVALDRNGDFIEHELPEAGTEEDKAFFNEVMVEVRALGDQTRRLYEEFMTGDSSYEKGNGYTKELVDRENQLVEKLKTFSDRKMDQILKMDPDDPATRNAILVFQHAQMFMDPIGKQARRDAILQRNNSLRERQERWRVYQRLNGNRPKEIEEDRENWRKAWSKLHRMEKRALRSSVNPGVDISEEEIERHRQNIRAGKSDILAASAEWAVEETQGLLERFEMDEPIKKAEMNLLMEKVAALVLHQILVREAKKEEGEPKPYYDRLKKHVNKNDYMKYSKTLAGTKEFQKSVNSLLVGKDKKEAFIKFLADDNDKLVAKKMMFLGIGPKPAAPRVTKPGR